MPAGGRPGATGDRRIAQATCCETHPRWGDRDRGSAGDGRDAVRDQAGQPGADGIDQGTAVAIVSLGSHFVDQVERPTRQRREGQPQIALRLMV